MTVGGVLRRKTEGVPSDGVKDLVPPHPLEPREQIPDRVHAHVSHVNATRRIREHLHAVELGGGDLVRAAGDRGRIPPHLPLGFDRLRLILHDISFFFSEISAILSSIPLMKAPDSSEPYLFPRSTASLIATT